MIVGLSGKLETGKTTAALYLERDHGFVRRSFAAILRRYTSLIFGCTEKQLEEPGFKKKSSGIGSLTWRDVMIRLGTFLRSLDSNFFVDRLDYSGRLVAIDDVRFKNEAQRIKDKGGIIIRLTRPKPTDGSPDQDISETDMDDWPWDYEIDNTKDFEHLFNQLDKILGPATPGPGGHD